MKLNKKYKLPILISTIVALLVFVIPLIVHVIVDICDLETYHPWDDIPVGYDFKANNAVLLVIFSCFFVVNCFIASLGRYKLGWVNALRFVAVASAALFPYGIRAYFPYVLYMRSEVLEIDWAVVAAINSAFMSVMAFILYKEETKRITTQSFEAALMGETEGNL